MFTHKYITRLAVCLTALLPVMLQSCKSDEEDLFDNYYNTPTEIEAYYGDVIELTEVKGDDEVLVIPSVVANLKYEIEDTNIVSQDYWGEIKAVGIGSTVIRIYNSKDELMREIPVTVKSPFELVEQEEIEISAYQSFDIVKPAIIETEAKVYDIYEFSSSNGNVYVDAYGKIQAQGSFGQTTVTVTYASTGEVVKTYIVTVTPTMTIELTSGQSIDLTNDFAEHGIEGSSFSSSDSDVAYMYGKMLYARKAGTTTLRNYYNGTEALIKVIVTAGPLTDLFKPFPFNLGYSVYLSQVKQGMSAYNQQYYPSKVYDGRTYEALECKPFDNATSITFYFSDSSSSHFYGSKLEFAIIETGHKSEDVLSWLFNNDDYTPVNSYTGETTDFSLYYGWSIYPVDGSWSTLKLRGY